MPVVTQHWLNILIPLYGVDSPPLADRMTSRTNHFSAG